MKSSHQQTWFEKTNGEVNRRPQLNRDISTEICVVGGGFVGITAALTLAEAGKRVVLIESSNIGYGSSGRDSSPLTLGVGTTYSDLVDIVGEEVATVMWKESKSARDHIIKRIKDYNIDCNWAPGLTVISHNKRQDNRLSQFESALEKTLGKTEHQSLNESKINSIIKSKHINSAVHIKNCGHIHPLKYLYAIAKAAEQKGAEIYETTPVLSITEGKKPQVVTKGGVVTCKHLIICGQAYMDELKPIQHVRTVTRQMFHVISEPLKADVLKEVLPTRGVICDCASMPYNIWITPDNRLAISGPDYSSHISDKHLALNMLKRARKLLYGLPHIKSEFVWRGPVGVAMNFVPVFEDFGNMKLIHGFTGHGITMASLGGEAAADAVLGKSDVFEIFTRIKPVKLPPVIHRALAHWGIFYEGLKHSFNN